MPNYLVSSCEAGEAFRANMPNQMRASNRVESPYYVKV